MPLSFLLLSPTPGDRVNIHRMKPNQLNDGTDVDLSVSIKGIKVIFLVSIEIYFQ